jgi:hypothetical protein
MNALKRSAWALFNKEWTNDINILLSYTERLILSDISKPCPNSCRDYFSKSKNIQNVRVTNRPNMKDIEIIDKIWSNEVFAISIYLK